MGDRYIFSLKRENPVTLVTPFLIWSRCAEITLEQIRCNLADFTFVRVILLHSHTTNQTYLLHKALDGLVIQVNLAIPYCLINGAVHFAGCSFFIV